MPITSLAHVCLKTTDLKRTREFYCDALGLEKQFNFIRNGVETGFYLKAGNGTFIEVFLADAIEPLGKQPIHHLCLETDDLAGLHARLRECGLTPGDLKTGSDQTPQFWITDPNGLGVEFQQYTPQSSQRTGKDVSVNW
ncbi:MAG: VOC family protein [Opitutaceae bacterium]|jgi:catechol 2,3-dioxygenase-like lactoylglutathione lyase family enzyme|nr:VOC family protein [Opitutaceae bacterium]